MMRKIISLTLVVLLGLALSGMLEGCGGDKGKAREYLVRGDKAIVIIENKSETLGGDTETMFTDLFGALSSGKAPDVASFARNSGDIKTLVDEMIGKAVSAKSWFSKIATLEDVPDYSRYADLKIKIIDANVAGLKQLKAFVDEAGNKLAAKPFDLIAFQTFVTEFGDSIQKQGEESAELQKQAADLKKEKIL